MKRTFLLLAVPAAGEAQTTKVFIAVDMEGIAGLVNSAPMGAGGHDYELGRSLAEEETNAAIRAAFEVGADSVFVIDSHGGKTNLRPTRLDPRAMLSTGGPRPYGMPSRSVRKRTVIVTSPALIVARTRPGGVAK